MRNKINSDKGLMTKGKDASGRTLNIGIKDVSDLIDWVLKNEITNDEAKMIINDKLLPAANSIASTNPTDNETKLLRIFFDLKEKLDEKPYDLRIVGGKYVTDKLKIKQMINSLNWKHEKRCL